MLAVHSHRLQEAGLAGAGGPDRHRRDRVGVLVVGDQASCVGVDRPGRHDPPVPLGEARGGEGRALHRDPCPNVFRPDHLDAQVRLLHRLGELAAQRRPRLVALPAPLGQHVLEQSPHRRLDGRLARRQDAALGIGGVGGHLIRQLLIPLHFRGDRHPQQVRAVEEAEREDPAVPAPDAHRACQGVGAEAPEPAEVARVQLHRRALVLPVAQRVHGRGQSSGIRSAHHDRHLRTPIFCESSRCLL